jgi:hypothetical protein
MLKDKENLPATKDTCTLSLIKMDPKKVFAFQEVMIAHQIAIATKVDTKMSQTSTDATLVIAFLSTVLSPRIVRTKTCSVLDQTILHSTKRAGIHRKDQASAFSLGTITETSYIMSMGTEMTNAEAEKNIGLTTNPQPYIIKSPLSFRSIANHTKGRT